jgi:hypothetical protein
MLKQLFDTKNHTDTQHAAPVLNHQPTMKSVLLARLAQFSERDASMFTETMLIAPGDANYILENHNVNNRALREYKVRELAQIILDKQWRVTSQGISFDRNGGLSDGQHRLAACALAGVPITVRVTWGEDPQSFAVLDTGARRSASDILSINGQTNTSVLAAGAKLLFYLENGQPRPSPEELLRLVTSREGLQDAASIAQRVAGTLKTSSGACVAAVYLIGRDSKHTLLLGEFLDRLIDGTGLKKNDPILLLRDGLIKKKLDQAVRGGQLRQIHIAACFIKAWNAHVKRKPISMLVFRPGANEAFPVAE